MQNMQNQQKGSRMVARGGDPWISVSLLSEHIYCPRAGIIQYESQEEDTGEELFHIGRRRKRVFYSLEQILKELKRQLFLLLMLVILSAVLLLIMFPAKLFSGDISQAPFLITSLLSCQSLRCLYIYVFHYLRAKYTQGVVPDPRHRESQVVKWWSLINDGFYPISPRDQYSDAQWHLVGRPWRILVKGNMRIPVYKKRPNRGTAGDRLFAQHYARMAAYCHLVEKCEGAWSPYGIVLIGDTHEGMTVPYQPGSKKTFHNGLVSTRTTLNNMARFMPVVPSNPQICVRCPHSRRDRLTGASECGSRFYWTPPNFRDDYE